MVRVTGVAGLTGDGSDVNLTHCSERQDSNALSKLVTKLILGKVIFFKLSHLLNAVSRDVQLFNVVGKDIVLRFIQLLNVRVKLVMVVAFDGSTISRRLVQPLHILVKLVNELADVGITILYKPPQFINIAVI